MPEVKFGNDSGSSPAPVIDVETKTVSTPVADVKVETTTTVASSSPGVPATKDAFKLGDYLPGFKDINLPRLNLTYSVGELGKNFTPGSIVFGKETILYSPAEIDQKQGVITRAQLPPVVICVIGIVWLKFQEKLAGQVGGEIVDTEDAVRAVGGTLDYNEWKLKKAEGMRRFEPMTELLLAIEKPAHVQDDGAVFGFTVGSRKMTVGYWNCKGSVYTEAMKNTFNYQRRLGCLQDGYFSRTWSLSTRMKSFKTDTGKFEAPVPVLAVKAVTDTDLMGFIHKVVGI
jgi:hypothetical protein